MGNTERWNGARRQIRTISCREETTNTGGRITFGEERWGEKFSLKDVRQNGGKARSGEICGRATFTFESSVFVSQRFIQREGNYLPGEVQEDQGGVLRLAAGAERSAALGRRSPHSEMPKV